MINALRLMLTIVVTSCFMQTVAVSADIKTQLQLSVSKTTYLTHEPLHVKLTVKNIGDSDVSIWTALMDPLTSGIVFNITEPDGNSYSWEPMWRISWVQTAAQALHLAPSESYSSTIDLTYTIKRESKNAMLPLLSQPGRYLIECRGRSYLDSNILELTAAEPTGIDRKAHEILLKYQPVVSQSSQFWDQGDKLRSVIEACPGSIYADYAKFYLARTLQAPHAWRSWDRPTQRESIRLYREVAEKLPNTPIGLSSLIMGGRNAAYIRNFADSIDMFGEAFASPEATNEDRIRILEWFYTTQLVAKNTFEASLAMDDVVKGFDLKLQAGKSNEQVEISSSHVKLELLPSNTILNGEKLTGMFAHSQKGHYYLSVPLIVSILRSHYQTSAFDHILLTEERSRSW